MPDAGTSPRHPWRPQSTHIHINHRWHVFIWLCNSYRTASYFSRPFLPFVMLMLKSKPYLQIACSSSWPCTSYLFVTFSFLQPLKHCRKYWCALDPGQTSGPSCDLLFWIDMKHLPIISWEWIFKNLSSNLSVSPRTSYYSLLLKTPGSNSLLYSCWQTSFAFVLFIRLLILSRKKHSHLGCFILEKLIVDSLRL